MDTIKRFLSINREIAYNFNEKKKMISPHDFYYKKLETEDNISPEKLHDIYSYIEKAQPGMNSKYDFFDVFTKISENRSCDDELIKKMFGFTIRSSMYHEKAYLLLDNGSKTLFDDIWANGPYEYNEKIWKSKHADENQLEHFYREFIEDATLPSLKKRNASLMKEFVKHPNVPDSVLSEVAISYEDLVLLASNPNIASKPAMFKRICKFSQTHNYVDNNPDKILEAFLKNTGFTWKQMAEAIDLEEQLNLIFNAKIAVIKKTTDKRIKLIFDFCRSDECPDEIRKQIYAETKEDDFLPQAAKDIFMF